MQLNALHRQSCACSTALTIVILHINLKKSVSHYSPSFAGVKLVLILRRNGVPEATNKFDVAK